MALDQHTNLDPRRTNVESSRDQWKSELDFTWVQLGLFESASDQDTPIVDSSPHASAPLGMVQSNLVSNGQQGRLTLH